MIVNKLTATRYGQMLYNVNDMIIGKSLELYGEWYQEEMDLMKQLIGPGDFCVDVGANIGCHTLFFAKSVGPQGHVISFEPQPTIFQLLCANVSLNHHLNVSTYNQAVGNKTEQVMIPSVDYSKPGNFGMVGIVKDEGNPVYPINMIVLDNLSFPHLKMLKIDVEGYESEVIKGAKKTIKKHRPFIYAENNQTGKSLELLTLIKDLKYHCYQHIVIGFNKTNLKGCKENIHSNYAESNIFCVPMEKNVTIDLPLL